MDETNGSAATQNISGVSSVPRSNSRRKGNKANSEAGTGKLCDVKMSCTVWEGGDEKGLNLQHLVSALLHSEEGGWKRAARAVPRQPPILLRISVQKISKKATILMAIAGWIPC